MKIKVCGMCHPSNIGELVKLKPNYIGFIFYPKSKRFIGTQIPDEIQALVPDYIQKVGVFVDEPFDSLSEKFKSNQLDIIQLHGKELPGYCERLKNLNIPVIKAFSIYSDFDFETVRPYDPFCDYYLFDSAGVLPGGTGTKFDWKKLDKYKGYKPFFLSGGIQPADMEKYIASGIAWN
jgi:phosphoribosylanthranilate isomerase